MIDKNKINKEEKKKEFKIINSDDAVTPQKENKAHNIKKQALGPNTRR